MMSAMSHDVRTYLTRLRLRIETLEPPSRAAAEKTIEDIQTLLGDSLAFAEADAVNFAGQRIDLAGILEKIAGSDQFTSDSVHLEIVARPTILGEASRLERAFVNLISNAIKYGEIAHVRLSEHASHAVVEISDKGPGIPVPLRERVFEPFFRMEGSRNRRVEGAGLGLAIARRLVERHGGVIELGAAPSGGLIVRVLLPRPHPR
jgi:signal transduction histidine kinase